MKEESFKHEYPSARKKICLQELFICKGMATCALQELCNYRAASHRNNLALCPQPFMTKLLQPLCTTPPHRDSARPTAHVLMEHKMLAHRARVAPRCRAYLSEAWALGVPGCSWSNSRKSTHDLSHVKN